MVIERDSLDCFINTPSKVHTVNVVFPAEDFETQLECEYKQPRYRHIIVISWVIIDAVPQLFHSIFIFKEKYTWSMFKPQRNSLFFYSVHYVLFISGIYQRHLRLDQS